MSTGLDCQTPQGRIHIAQQHAVIAACCAEWRCESVVTDDTQDSPIDVLFSGAGVLLAVAEVKCRPTLTRQQLRAFKEPGYLITHRKVREGVQIAKQLRVPYYVIVGMSDVVAWWKVSDAAGALAFDIRSVRTATQATCNGGKAFRLNAFLPLRDMHTLRYAEPLPMALDGDMTDDASPSPSSMVSAEEMRWS